MRFRDSDILSDSQSFRLSEFQTLRGFRLSEFQTLRVSDSQSFRLSELQTRRLSEYVARRGGNHALEHSSPTTMSQRKLSPFWGSWCCDLNGVKQRERSAQMWRRLSTRHHHSDKTKVITPRHGYQHGSGVGSLKPQIYEATTVSDRIFDPLCFRDVGVRLVSECGAHCESAGTSRQFHENACIMSKKTVKVNPTQV